MCLSWSMTETMSDFPGHGLNNRISVMGSPGRLPKRTPFVAMRGIRNLSHKDNKERSASESASRSNDPGSLTHDLPMFRTRTVICPAEVCAGPHYPNTPHSQSHRSLYLA